MKHSRLQALFNLIVTIIEATSPQANNAGSNASKLSFIRLLIRKGMINDLAKTPHSLDLSSPYLVSTVNSMLKPLEKLTSLAHHQVLTNKSENKEEAKPNEERRTDQESDQNGELQGFALCRLCLFSSKFFIIFMSCLHSTFVASLVKNKKFENYLFIQS